MSEKSLMKLAADLGVSFSAAKILEDYVRAEYDVKLRAADRLCVAAKRMNEDIFDTGKTEFITVALFHINKIRKAIADYGGKA